MPYALYKIQGVSASNPVELTENRGRRAGNHNKNNEEDLCQTRESRKALEGEGAHAKGAKAAKGIDRIMAGQNYKSGEFDLRLTQMNADGERIRSRVSHTYRWQVTEKDRPILTALLVARQAETGRIISLAA